jgi:hypothetical protein
MTLLTFTPSARTIAAMARANVEYATAELKVCRDRKVRRVGHRLAEDPKFPFCGCGRCLV